MIGPGRPTKPTRVAATSRSTACAAGCEVFLAVGAALGLSLDIPGADAQGVTEAMAFLRQYNIRGSVPVGRHVAVIGGGNAAIDAARTAVRLGAESVTVLYRRTREEMPAYAEEIEEALQEGVVLRTLIHPEAFAVKNGRVTGVRCHPMKLGAFDRSGRRRPEDAAEAAGECSRPTGDRRHRPGA